MADTEVNGVEEDQQEQGSTLPLESERSDDIPPGDDSSTEQIDGQADETSGAGSSEESDGFDDDVLSLASSYGMTEQQARDLGSPEALEQHMRQIDQTAWQQWQWQNQQQQPPAQQYQQPQQSWQPAPYQQDPQQYPYQQQPPPQQPPPQLSPIDEKQFADMDEGVQSLAAGYNQLAQAAQGYEQRISQQQQQFEQVVNYLIAQRDQERQQHEYRQQQEFHDAVDALNDAELFGDSRGFLNPMYQQNRASLGNAYMALQQQFPQAPREALIQRAMRAVFHPQLEQREARKRASAAKNQSRSKIGSPSSSPTHVQGTDFPQEAHDLARDPELQAIWRNGQR